MGTGFNLYWSEYGNWSRAAGIDQMRRKMLVVQQGLDGHLSRTHGVIFLWSVVMGCRLTVSVVIYSDDLHARCARDCPGSLICTSQGDAIGVFCVKLRRRHSASARGGRGVGHGAL